MRTLELFKVVTFLFLCTICMVSCLNDDETKDEVENIIMYVSAETGEYYPVYDLDVKKEGMKVKEKGSKDWVVLSFSEIDGFEYERGYEYTLEVKKITLANPPMDGSNVKYELIKINSKEKVSAMN